MLYSAARRGAMNRTKVVPEPSLVVLERGGNTRESESIRARGHDLQRRDLLLCSIKETYNETKDILRSLHNRRVMYLKRKLRLKKGKIRYFSTQYIINFCLQIFIP